MRIMVFEIQETNMFARRGFLECKIAMLPLLLVSLFKGHYVICNNRRMADAVK